MLVFLNGRLVPEDEAVVSVFDRSFLFGDGLFETIRLYGGKPFRWVQHMDRLLAGAALLNIKLPFAPDELRRAVDSLVVENQLQEGLVRITLSRGIGRRGYSAKGADTPILVMTCHPASVTSPDPSRGWRLITSSVRVPAHDPLALYKTCNKLPQIMARTEAEARGADEALVLNSEGDVAEAASSNLFWIERGIVYTTPLASGILAGVTRALVIELCANLGLPCVETPVKAGALKSVDAIFLTMSSLEIVPVIHFDGVPVGTSPLVESLREAYREIVRLETAVT